MITTITNEDGTGRFPEGVTLSNNIPLYGPLAGTILVGAETHDVFQSIDVNTNVITSNFSTGAESAGVIIPNKSLYISASGDSIIKVPPSAFATLPGKLLLIQEIAGGPEPDSRVKIAHWTGAYFVLRSIVSSGDQYEGIAFGPN